MRLQSVLLACLIVLLPMIAQASAAQTSIVLVRHAEKADDDARDPSLSAAGLQRAFLLAERLSAVPLSAIYATPYRRTQLTAAPVAQRQRLPISVRAASEAAATFADMLRRRHAGETVLVVGHSNTIPALVEALSGQAVAPISEHEYDRLFVIRLEQGHAVHLRVEAMGGEPLRD